MLKVITLFTGIGAQEAALKRLGLDFEIVGISEETRSGLLLHVERLLTESVLYGTQPKYLLLENVKALVSKKFMPDFQRWLDKLEQLGYNNYWQILNAKDYGIPQNRERVFVVSIRKDVDTKGYKFPSPVPLEKRLKDMLEPCVDEKYYLSADKVEKLTSQIKEKEVSNTIRCGGRGSLDGKHTWDIIATPVNLDKDGNARAICNNYSKQGVDNIPMLSNGYCIRKLTPRECWRLMGFTDIEFECAKLSGVSNSQLYKQAGNSIVVNVLVGIFKGLFDDRF